MCIKEGQHTHDKYTEGNLANGGRFFATSDKIYGPLGNQGKLSVYSLSNSQTSLISDDNTFDRAEGRGTVSVNPK